MQLFISDDFLKEKDKITIKEKRIIEQIRKVLRAKKGYKFFLQNKTGTILRYKLEIENILQDTINANILSIEKNNQNIKNKGIIQAILNKTSKMELIVQKLTEIGVPKIYFVKTTRSILKDIKGHKFERLEKIALEAAEQSFSWYLPKIKVFSSFDEIDGTKAICDFEGKYYKEINFNNIDYIIIGPEGGFSKEDIEKIKPNKKISLGPKILRSETASIISGFILMS